MSKQNLSVMMSAIFVMGLVAGQAMAQVSFSENFEGLSAGGLDGQNGWSAAGEIELNSQGGGHETGFGPSMGARNSNGNPGTFTATHSLGATISGGIITATALVSPSCGSCQKGGSILVSDGGSNSLAVQVLGRSPDSTISLIGPGGTRTTTAPFAAGVFVNGSSGSGIVDFNDALFVEVKLEYNLDTGVATGTVRDVLDYNGRPTTYGALSITDTFDSFTPFDVTTVGFLATTASNSVNNSGVVDDVMFEAIPEPASLTLLALGGLMMFWRRQPRSR